MEWWGRERGRLTSAGGGAGSESILLTPRKHARAVSGGECILHRAMHRRAGAWLAAADKYEVGRPPASASHRVGTSEGVGPRRLWLPAYLRVQDHDHRSPNLLQQQCRLPNGVGKVSESGLRKQ